MLPAPTMMDGVHFARCASRFWRSIRSLGFGAVAGLAAFSACSLSVLAQAQSISSSAEASRRAAEAQDALGLLKKGDEHYNAGSYGDAVTSYREALNLLPEQANVVSQLRMATAQRLAQASVEYARDLGRKGDYPEANRVLNDIELVLPNDLGVAEMRGRLQDPIRSNPGASKEHTANVDQVRRLLYEAEGYLNLGKFGRAEMTYEDVLRLDPYNKAARRGMERAHFYQADYGTAAYDQARAALLEQVSAAWETPVLPLTGTLDFVGSDDGGTRLQITAVFEKLKTIPIPILDMEDATLDEAIEYLQTISRQNDTTTLDENAKGVSFVTRMGSEFTPRRITANLRSITLEQALKVVTELSGTQYRIDEFAVVITPLGVVDDAFLTRTFRVPPDFLSSGAIAQSSESDDPFDLGDTNEGPILPKKLTAKEKLIKLGVPWLDDANASFNPVNSTLTVRHTVTNLDYIAQIVDQIASAEPVQVVVRTTILDVDQGALEELGHDWMLGFFGGKKWIVSGGTTGNGGEIIDMLPLNPATSGLRSGSEVSPLDSIDAAIGRQPRQSASGAFSSSASLFGGSSTIGGLAIPTTAAEADRSPGFLQVRGVLGNGLAQLLMRGFNQHTGIDVMVRPEVVTRSGQNAVIKSVREFIYPTEYEPPELPNSVGGDTSGIIGGPSISPTSSIATPATPTSFTTTGLGFVLDVLPQVSGDRRTIDIVVKPEIREFEGFINYGSPITGQSQAGGFNFGNGGISLNQVTNIGEITRNDILQPVFRVVRASTEVTVADGQTLVLGGVITETTQLVNDKVPVLGHLPFLGRFFSQRALSSRKRNILILLNVELQDPSGKPYRTR